MPKEGNSFPTREVGVLQISNIASTYVLLVEVECFGDRVWNVNRDTLKQSYSWMRADLHRSSLSFCRSSKMYLTDTEDGRAEVDHVYSKY